MPSLLHRAYPKHASIETPSLLRKLYAKMHVCYIETPRYAMIYFFPDQTINMHIKMAALDLLPAVGMTYSIHDKVNPEEVITRSGASVIYLYPTTAQPSSIVLPYSSRSISLD